MNEYKIGFTNKDRKRISILSFELKDDESFSPCIRNSFRDAKFAKKIFKIIAEDKNIDKKIYSISSLECEEIFKFCEYIEEMLVVNSF
ncbi:hypothetical protein [Clostridium sp. C8]|jgi:hypothetical protein|uniref:hypothetical protein n=1 Tax=Clostridium sp. C8 TaxID=1667357 RepID=UPI00062E5AC4|nr:hypothetical protein [Clostridium sp. C8]KLE15323.1 hypothetical protein AAT22_12480 [Clostridium sp. C8]MDU1566152.1 hypothetical protein [Clostridium sp.]